MEIEDIHKNVKILIGGIPYNVDEAEFMKPGKGRAIYRLKLRNLVNGSTADRTYHSGEKVEEAHTTNFEGQYLYQEGEHYVFMNTETFEQLLIDEKLLGNKKDFLKESMVVSILMMADQPIDITLPTFVELKVKVVESGVAPKRATITPQTKSAVLETGYTMAVPAFVKEGDVIKVDTRTGGYVERVGTKK
ncbi:MAG: elongation factor P [Chloroflexi bacterium]|nr:elongation factor P [Chloroflexota bacterium]